MTTARIVLAGDVSPLRRSLAEARQSLNQFGQQSAQPFRALRDQLGNLGNLMIGFGAIKLGGLADQATLIQARLKDVTGSTAAAIGAQSALYQSAQRLQVGYEDMAGSFSKMLPAVKEMGGGASEATKLAEIMAATAKLSGSSSQEAAASAQQFAQALGSGVLQGDELKSILENNGALSRAMAKGLGVGVGELKRLGAEGKLTSDVVANALLGQYDELMARSSEIPDTMGGAWTQVTNAFQGFVAAMNEGTGAFGVVAAVLKGIARFIDTVREVLAGTGTEADKLGRNQSIKAWGETVGAILAYLVDVGRAVGQMFASMGRWVGALAAAGTEALGGNFAGAAGILRDRLAEANGEMARMKELLTGGAGSALRNYALRGDYGQQATVGGDSQQLKGKGKGTGKGKPGKKGDGDASQMAYYEAMLAQEQQFLAVAGETRRIGKEQELEYWRTILRTANVSAKDKIAIQKKVATLEVQIRQQAAQQQEQIDEDNARTAEQLALLRVDGQRIAAQALLDNGEITQQQMLQMERQYEQQRYEIQRAALEQRLQLLSKDPTLNAVEMARLRNQVLLLEQQQTNKMAEQQGKGKGGGLLGNLFGDTGDAIGQAFDGLLTRTQTWAGALQGVFASLRQSFITNLVTEPLKAWIVGKAQMLAQELGFATTKQAIDATSSATTIGVKAAETTAVASMNAVQAGTGAAASQAPIPIIGPALALAAMAAVFAAVSGLGGKVKSARNGYDIPAGVNPLTQLHEEEMVLPKGPANVLRELAAGGGAAGGGGDTIQLSVQALDARSFERYLSGPGGDSLVRAIQMRQRSRRA